MIARLGLCFLLWVPVLLCAQQTQSIQGVVIDKTTRQSIIGASVVITSLDPQQGTTTDELGRFSFADIPVGRHILQVSYLGYNTYNTEGLILNSSRELVVSIELEEAAFQIDEVVVTASNNTNAPVNASSLVSTRSFSVEETELIAASVNDPGRMALAYPGVAQGGDDNENDIIIRGNSSFGMLWRLEGVDIPNPNHFARPGTSGGGITVFSAQLLSRSDFSTGGMPAEYGNALSGAFDIHFRKGNKQKREYRTKLGLLGLDFATEGPISKGQSSYLVNYRYSTLGLLNRMGFHLVGERVNNDFQDLSFNLSFDGKNGKDFVTVFGLGGLSLEQYLPVDNPEERDYSISDHWEDRFRESNMGATGVTYTRLIDDKSYFKAVVSLVGSEINYLYDTLDLSNERFRYNSETYEDVRVSLSSYYNRKLGKGLQLKTGLFAHQIAYDFFKETRPRSSTSDIEEANFGVDVTGGGNTQQLQYFVQLSGPLGKRLRFNGGLHSLYLGLNQTFSIEPRLAFQYQLSPQQTLGLAYGLHSKTLPLAAYFYTDAEPISSIINFPNKELDFIKAHHLILSYNYVTKQFLKISAEAYYQSIFNVPVSTDPSSLYWMLNDQASFPQFEVTGEGRGTNYGVDLAVEKFFSNQTYFLLTASLFDATFQPADGNTYNSRFDNDFVSSLTVGREFSLKKARVLQVGARVLYNGGMRYSPHDQEQSKLMGSYVIDQALAYTERIPNYLRIDMRIAYRFNRAKTAGVLSLDIQNVSNRSNPRGVGYSAEDNSLYFTRHSSGLIPVLSYQIDF